MDALTFIINVKSEGAISAVSQLKTSMAGLQNMADQLKNISLVNMVQGLQQFSQGITDLTGPGADFQQSMADLSAITGIAGKDLKTLGDAARDMGEKSGVSATGAAESFKLLASNINIAKIGGVAGLVKLQEKVITLAHAAGIDLPTAANAMTFALNEFQMPVTDAARVMNVLGAGAKYGAAFIPDLSESLKNVGSVAHMSGLSIEETTGAIEVLSQRGIKGAEAGVMLRNVLLMLQTHEIPGVDMKAQGFVGALKSMQKYMGDTTMMTKIFRRESLNAAEVLIGSADAVGEMGKKVTGTNVAEEQAAIRTETYNQAVKKIRAQFDEFKISIFESTKKMLPWVQVVGEGTASFSQLVPALWMFKNAVMIGVWPAIKSLVVGTRDMIACMEMATSAQEALNIAWMTNPVGVVIAGIVLLGAALWGLSKIIDTTTDKQAALNEVNKRAIGFQIREREEADRLFDALKKTNPKSDERKRIIEQLNEKYPELLKNLDLESAGVNEIATAYRLVITQMDKKAKKDATQQIYTEAYEKLLKKQIDKQNEYWNASVSGMKKSKAGETAYVDATTQPEQKALTAIRSVRDKEDADAAIDGLKNIKGHAGKVGMPGKTMLKLPGASDESKDDAVSGLSGGSKNFKNINITVGSFIAENKNIIEKGDMSVGELEAKLRKVFFNLLNDANYAAQ